LHLSARHHEHWRSLGEMNRGVPQTWRSEDTGEVGWFFPATWVREFAAGQKAGVYPPPRRVRYQAEEMA
jgi:hypothetical protein